jgi:hypothetical protein
MYIVLSISSLPFIPRYLLLFYLYISSNLSLALLLCVFSVCFELSIFILTYILRYLLLFYLCISPPTFLSFPLTQFPENKVSSLPSVYPSS